MSSGTARMRLRLPEELTCSWLRIRKSECNGQDAHADNRIAETTESLDIRLVGVPVSVMVGQTAEDYRKKVCGLTVPIAGEHILVSDGRMNIPEFDENLKNAGSKKVSGEIFDDPEKWKEEIQKLADQTDLLYLSVDADILALNGFQLMRNMFRTDIA